MTVREVLEKVGQEKFDRVVDRHIRRYQARIKGGDDHVRVDECQAYLELWESIKAKGGKGLTQAEANEVIDAWYGEEFR